MKLSDREEEFCRVAESGATKAEIMAKLGITGPRVNNLRHRVKVKTGRDVRWADFSPSRPRGSLFPLEQAERQGVVRYGRIGHASRSLDRDVQEWLLRSVPDGSTVADFAMSCVLDAYFDEKEAGE